MRLSDRRVSPHWKRDSKFGWLTGVHRGGGCKVPIQSLKGQPQSDAQRAGWAAFLSLGKTLVYSVLVVRLICAASGPKTSALGRTSYLPIGRHGFILLDNMLICRCCTGRSSCCEHGGIHIPGDTVATGLQRHTMLAQ